MAMKSINLFILSLLFLTIFANNFAKSSSDCTVNTLNGVIRGRRNITLLDEKNFCSYRGIPFAEPPLKHLRFKPPVPISNWPNVRDALEYGSECTQRIINTKTVFGKEDCLFLNVFVPENPTNDKLPVMFYIHGGGFVMGTGNEFGPDFLVNNDVILVTSNYRLGVLGFMSLGNTEYSGNMGMKDQQLALKWINDNIEHFGGDKDKITIFGESAGGGSVHYHTIAPMSQGMFKRAIVQSGSMLNPWALYLHKGHFDTMMDFGVKFGGITPDYDHLVNYLQEVSPELIIIELREEIYTAGTDTKKCGLLWAPVLEDSNVNHPFITEFPEDVLKKPFAIDIDTMFGFTSTEMYIIAIEDVLNPTQLKIFDEKLKLQLPKKNLKYEYDSKEYQEIADDIRKHYFPTNSEVGPNTIAEYQEMMSDVWFNYGIINSIKYQLQHSSGKTFVYKFSVESNELNLIKEIFGINLADQNLPGAVHGDELLYLFTLTAAGKDVDYSKYTEDSIEVKTIRLITKLWSNFAKYGSPTLPSDQIQIPPAEIDKLNYVDITNDGMVLRVDPISDGTKFWDGIYQKHENAFHM